MEASEVDLSSRLYADLPLDVQTREIRLVRVLPTQKDQLLSCALQTCPLDAAPSYIALSYEWGSDAGRGLIQVNGYQVHVRNNLWRFLDCVMKRPQLSDRLFWIDAICIDQLDDIERSHQVHLMAQIFQGARLVIAWLGSSFEDSDLAFNTLDKFMESLKGNKKQEAVRLDPVRELCHQSYWTRRWILQELVLAQECILYTEDRTLPLNTLEAFLGHVAFAALSDAENNRPSMGDEQSLLSSPASSMIKQRRLMPSSTALLTRMLACSQLKCQDPKDMVYALLGISRPIELFPDYTVRTPQLFNDLLRKSCALDRCQSLAEALTICKGLVPHSGILERDVFSLSAAGDPDQVPTNDEERDYSLRREGISLWWARIYQHAKIQKLWIREASLEAQDALITASAEGNVKVVQMLIDAGVDLDAQHIGQGTALYTASSEGRERVVQMLIDVGANVDAQRQSFGNALQVAASSGYVRIVQMLIQAGADVNAGQGLYGTALQAASIEGCVKIVAMLLAAGADVNAKDEFCGQALQAASSHGHEMVVRMLLDAGADANACQTTYGTALQAASSLGSENIVRVLLDSGADVNAKDELFGNALLAASFHGHEKVVQMLLDAGANVDARGTIHSTALEAASLHGHQKVARMLVDAGAKATAGYDST